MRLPLLQTLLLRADCGGSGGVGNGGWSGSCFLCFVAGVWALATGVALEFWFSSCGLVNSRSETGVV